MRQWNIYRKGQHLGQIEASSQQDAMERAYHFDKANPKPPQRHELMVVPVYTREEMRQQILGFSSPRN